jgi:hypothetical protein
MESRTCTLLLLAIILSKELTHSSLHLFPIEFSNLIYTYHFQNLCDTGKLADPSVLLQVHYVGLTFSYEAPQN